MKPSLKILLRNLHSLTRYDYHQYDIDHLKRWIYTSEMGARSDILRCYEGQEDCPYQDEVDFVKKHGISIFPYTFVKRKEPAQYGWDSNKKLPYALLNGKKLFFPSDHSPQQASAMCDYYIEQEQLVGEKYMTKAPHQYFSSRVHADEGDVFVDVGAAEGLVALSVIEKVKKVYLIECDKNWSKVLRATFEPWKDKCVIVNKMVSDHNSKNTIRLDSLLEAEKESSLFIKMDIEGNEVCVLEASRDFLSKREKTKMAICTYHRQSDADVLGKMIDEMGFIREFSEGWMLHKEDPYGPWQYPFFRHGLIRAWK